MKYIKIILLLLVIQSCKPDIWTEKTLNLCLRDHGRYSCFVGLRLKIGAQVVPCIIMNDDLFQYFNAKKATSQKEYERLVKVLVKGKKELTINDNDINEYNFLTFTPSGGVVTQDIQKGKDFVLKSYFTKIKDNQMINVSLSDDAKKELIYALFDWGIVSKFDDESGRLYLPLRQFP